MLRTGRERSLGDRDRGAPGLRRPRLWAHRARGGGRLSELPDLQRFRDAQSGGTYERALTELRAGRKTGHWIWFVFPQLDGLGRSPTAHHYSIRSLQHARQYAADPLLGARLRDCFHTLLELPASASAEDVLGQVDAMKLRSCATLFARTGDDTAVEVLRRFYGGAEDAATIRLLASPGG
ncbi:MAG TPA: DUF1810 domain-containing protein [Solirubrobacteraceae bacterium]